MGKDSELPYLGILWKWKILIAAGALAGALVTAAVVLRAPRMYEAEALLLATESKVPGVGEGRGATAEVRPMSAAMVTIAKSLPIARKIVEKLRLDAPPWNMRVSALVKRINVKMTRESNLIQLGVQFPDRKLAMDVANLLAGELVAINTQLAQSDTAQARDFIKESLDKARAEMDKLEEQKLKAGNSEPLEAINKRIALLQTRQTQLQQEILDVDGRIGRLNAIPMMEEFAKAKEAYLKVHGSVPEKKLKEENESILVGLANLSNFVRSSEISIQGEKARLKTLNDELKKQKEVLTLYKSVDRDIEAAALAREGRDRAPTGAPLFRMKTEELNPVHADLLKKIHASMTKLSELDAQSASAQKQKGELEAQFEAGNTRLARGSLELKEAEQKYKALESQLAAEEGKNPSSLTLLAAKKKAAGEELKGIREEMEKLSAEVERRSTNKGRLNVEYALASDAYKLYSKKFSEASLSVTSKVPELKIVAPAVIPEEPVSRQLFLNSIIGGFIGVFTAILLSLAIENYAERKTAQAKGNAAS